MTSVPTRRQLLRGLGLSAAAPVLAGVSAGVSAGLLAGCGPGGAGSGNTPGVPVTRLSYGSDPSQFGELTLPAGSDRCPVAVVVHGGYWSTGYGLELGRPLAADLVGAGVATWNIEYRRVGSGSGGSGGGGGGWPATGLDAAAAVDLLAGAGQRAAGGRLDLDRVVALGHSAGGQLAGWLAARPGLAAGVPGSGPRVRLSGVVSQAGVLDLVEGSRLGLGGGAIDAFLGGSPTQVPQAYAQASPVARVPIDVPSGLETVCVHGSGDTVVPPSQSERFVAADRGAGGRASLRMVSGDHFAMITLGTPAWQACREETLRLLGR